MDEELRRLALAPPFHRVVDIQRRFAVRGVGDADHAFLRARLHGTYRGIARSVGAEAVDVREVLPGQGTAADRDAWAIEVHHQFAPSLSVVTVAAAVHQRAVGVDHQVDLGPGCPPAGIPLPRFPVGLGQCGGHSLAQREEWGFLALLQCDQHLFERPARAVLAQAHHQLAVGPLPLEFPGAAGDCQCLAQYMGEKMLGWQVMRARVISGPAEDDALVVHARGPAGRVSDQLADGAGDSIAARHRPPSWVPSWLP